jgi:GH25 family lysozyme M1 (1,4-beta-N-acetylmuramidase)|nr:GH25 family lysozyme [Kofleriaceae bacterium]
MKHALVAACLCAPAILAIASTAHADTVCGSGPTVQGIDVSDYQGTIDWSAVAGDGIEFAFVRVSDGLDFPDSSFQDDWEGSRAAGVVHGAYQFFEPDQDPIAQADMLLAAAGPMQADDLPPVIDVEVTDGLDSATVSAAVQAWVDHVQAAIGRAPIVYTGKYFWDDNVGADMATSPLWHAQYTSASCPDISATWASWALWQYDDNGSVDGIPAGGVDMDRWNGDSASLHAFLGPPGACGTIDATGGVIDNGDACFETGGPPTGLRDVDSAGMGGSLVWTHTTADAEEQNFAQWNLSFAAAGTYHVEVYTDGAYAQSKLADYVVKAAGQDMSFTIDQGAVSGWQALGDIAFAAGGGQSIHLGDNTGEAETTNTQLVFDAVRLTVVGDGGSGAPGSDQSSGSSGSGGNGGGPNASSGCDAGGAGGAGWLWIVGIGLVVAGRRAARSRN